MASQVAELSPVVKQLSVVVAGDRLTRELDKAYSKLNQTAKIKGFRSGKIPRQVLERYFRKDVEADVLGRAISEAYREAVVENKLEPVAQPEINAGEFVPGQDFSFVAKVEVKPAITLQKYKGLIADKKVVKVTDEELNAEIERLRTQVSTVQPVADRQDVQAGDLVTTNFAGTVDGNSFVGGQGSAYVIEQGAGRFFKEIEDALIGKKIGEQFEVDVQIPEEYRTKAVAGKKAHFSVTVTELKKRVMPALDDEFAKDVGDYESFAELKEKTRENLQKRHDDQADADVRETIMTQLIEGNPYELPPTLVERQIDMRIYQALGRMTPQQVQRMGLDRNAMREDMREGAVRQVRGALLLEAVATQEKLEVSDADIEAHFEKLAGQTRQPVERVRAAFTGDRREDLRSRLLSEKALDFVTKNAQITEKNG